MSSIVILQPQFFPWVGVFEQIRLADCYVHYDDAQFPQGRSLISRVQVKSMTGIQWLTAPVIKKNTGAISEVLLDNTQDWQEKHLRTLNNIYAKAPFRAEMTGLVEQIYKSASSSISALNILAIEKISEYFELQTKFIKSSGIAASGKSTDKLVNICKQCNATTYITGWGAKNYIDYDKFENNNIKLCYMDYKKIEYPQLYGEFTPYVSILDLIANCGTEGKKYIQSPARYWKDMESLDR